MLKFLLGFTAPRIGKFVYITTEISLADGTQVIIEKKYRNITIS